MTVFFMTMISISSLHAEEKTCVVKGMECQNCVEMISKDVCTDAYSTCHVSLIDKKAHLGQIHVATKDPANKVDMKRIDAAVEKMNYSVASCAEGAPTKPSAKR